MSQMSIEDEVLLENEEELNELEYFGDEEKPIFESVRVTKKDFSIYELYRKYNYCWDALFYTTDTLFF